MHLPNAMYLSLLMALQVADLPALKVCTAIAASSTSTDAWPQALQKVWPSMNGKCPL